MFSYYYKKSKKIVLSWGRVKLILFLLDFVNHFNFIKTFERKFMKK